MRKITLFVLFFITSCSSVSGGMFCVAPSIYAQEQAQRLLDQWSTFRDPSVSQEQAEKIFGCHYRPGSDVVYSVKGLWSTTYILSRYRVAVIARDVSDGEKL